MWRWRSGQPAGKREGNQRVTGNTVAALRSPCLPSKPRLGASRAIPEGEPQDSSLRKNCKVQFAGELKSAARGSERTQMAERTGTCERRRRRSEVERRCKLAAC